MVILPSYTKKMAEKKTKWSEKEQEKKITRRTLPAKKVEKSGKTSISKERATTAISSKAVSTQDKEGKVSFRVLLLFFFSLALLLFAIYKVFIYWGEYWNTDTENSSSKTSVFSIKNPNPTEEIVQDEDPITADIVKNENTSVLSSNGEEDSITNDINLIQDFYSHLMNNEIDEMNQYVDSPLRTSSTWKSHWSSKNIWIFTKHIINDNISLDNITLVPWSDNKEKKTRKYWYTLWYTIDTNETFSEDWEITLLDRNWKTLISEIMCKTDWCSHSPFFWPQNYNLK